MRLINAEKLLEDIRRSCMTSKDVEALVNAQPIAYDLDKVVKDLEEYAHSDICSSCHSCRTLDDSDDIECENCGALGALEIVKQGGRL